jgi:hypothetical protein
LQPSGSVIPKKSIGALTVVLACLGTALLMTSPLPSNVFFEGRTHVAHTTKHAAGLPLTLGENIGSDWSPYTDPLSLGHETTINQARSRAGYPVYAPNVPLASDEILAYTWVGTEAPDAELLPNRELTTIALSYSSGLLVTYIPWQYGPAAPPFSQAQNAAYYEATTSQTPSGMMQTDLIEGIPVRVIFRNFRGQDNPGSVKFELGTSNEDAITVTVQGRHSTSDLESVASSIIAQWQEASG